MYMLFGGKEENGFNLKKWFRQESNSARALETNKIQKCKCQGSKGCKAKTQSFIKGRGVHVFRSMHKWKWSNVAYPIVSPTGTLMWRMTGIKP